MKVGTVEIPKTAGKDSANSKNISSKGFGDILQDFEKKGGAAQLLAGLTLGLQIPQQMIMQNQQNTQQDGAGTAQINILPLIEEFSQMSQKGILITANPPNNVFEADGVFSSVLQNTPTGMELPQQTASQTTDVQADIQLTADLKQDNIQVISNVLRDSDNAVVPKTQISWNTHIAESKTGAESTIAGTAVANTNLGAAVNQAGSIQAVSPQVPTQGSFDSQLYTAVSSGPAAAESVEDIQNGVKTVDVKAFANADDKNEVNFKVQDTSSQKTIDIQTAPSDQGKSQQAALLAKDLAETDNSNDDAGLNNKTDVNDTFSIALTQQNRIESSGGDDQTLKTDTAKQVADAVKQAYDNGRSEIRLHLSPEDLGGINIRIISQGGTLTLRITADNQHTGQLLASGMHELTQSLQNVGITMDKVEVSYTGFSGFDSAASQQQQQQQQQQQNFGSQSYHLPKWVPAMQNAGDIIPPAVSEQTDTYVAKISGLSILA